MVRISVRTEGTRAVVTVTGSPTPGGHIERLQETIDDLLQQGVAEFILKLDTESHIDSRVLGHLVQVTSPSHAGADTSG